MLLEFAPRNAPMKLHCVEMVGFHETQAVLHARADVLCRMNVPRGRARPGHASALRGQEVFRSAMCDIAADQLLATPIVDGCVDKVDALVEDGVENLSRIVAFNLGTSRGPTQFHAP